MYAVQQCQVFEGEPRRTHLHAQRLHLVGASHGAAIVVGQHHHGHVLQTWLKHTLATDIKIVDVHQSKLRDRIHAQPPRFKRRTTPTTTPHTSKGRSALSTMAW